METPKGFKEVSKPHCQNYTEGQLLSEEGQGKGWELQGIGKCSKSGKTGDSACLFHQEQVLPAEEDREES